MKITKKISKYSRLLIILLAIFSLEVGTKTLENKVENENLNKSLDLGAMAAFVDDIENQKNQQIQEEKEKKLSNVITTLTGNLTGYVYNCPSCSGHLACTRNVDLSNGNVFYKDNTYGNVRIVASSSNLPCGSIISFEKNIISSEPVVAIVLDRGVSGNTIDLLVDSNATAYNKIGRSKITYNVLRKGWE